MAEFYDVVVVGLGAMGSASASELARRGKKVLGLDRFTPPHALGSSHGSTRIIRQAYFEDPLYVPLVQAAQRRWLELEKRCGQPLLVPTGGIMLGPPDGVLVSGARTSAITHGLPYEELSAREVRRRFPPLRAPDEFVGIYEPEAGVLFPEASIRAFLEEAAASGAEIRTDEPVLRWHGDRGGVGVETEKGTYRAHRLLLAAGAWIPTLLRDLHLPLEIERNAVHWFEAKGDSRHFAPERCPIYVWEYEPERFWYGFPDMGEGVKVALHYGGEITTADQVRRQVEPQEGEEVRRLLARYLPDADGSLLRSSVCLYTKTPDGHFLIDHHPEHPQVVLASPCSGHGFKFAAVLGEVLADLLTDGETSFDLTPFRLARLLQGA